MIAEQSSNLVWSGEIDVDFLWSKPYSRSPIRRAFIHAIVESRAQNAPEEGPNVPPWLKHATWPRSLRPDSTGIRPLHNSRLSAVGIPGGNNRRFAKKGPPSGSDGVVRGGAALM